MCECCELAISPAVVVFAEAEPDGKNARSGPRAYLTSRMNDRFRNALLLANSTASNLLQSPATQKGTTQRHKSDHIGLLSHVETTEWNIAK